MKMLWGGLKFGCVGSGGFEKSVRLRGRVWTKGLITWTGPAKTNKQIISFMVNFSKTNKVHSLARALLLVFGKFTRAYLFQIVLEIMWLPIVTSISCNEIIKLPKDFRCCHSSPHHSPHRNNSLFISYTITEFCVTSSLVLDN